MKRAIQALGALAVMAGFFAAAPAAHAADYTGNCAGAPAYQNGNIIITDSGSCTISHSTMTADGYITINAAGSVNVKKVVSNYNLIEITSGGTTDTEDLTANGYHVKIYSPSGKVTVDGNINALNYAKVDAEDNDVEVTGTITANYSYVDVRGQNVNIAGKVTSTTYGNILLFARENLKTVDIEGAPGYVIDLKARRDTGSAQFVIGGSGQDNGVNGQITAHPGADSPYYASTIVSISNGAGGIELADSSKISVAATSSYRAGYIILDAKDDTLTMPGSTLSANGNGTKGAGLIVLVADTIDFGNNATVEATQDSGISGTLHGVLIAAETINYNGLTLKGDGDGADQYSAGYVQFVPKEGVTVEDQEDPLAPYITAVIDFDKEGDITLAGSGDLSVSANGDNTAVYVQSSKTTFDGGAVSIEAKGKNGYHSIRFQTKGTYTGSKGVSFVGSGAVTLDASALDPDEGSSSGGQVTFYVDKIIVDASSISVKANGPSSGDGDGGEIVVSPQNGFVLNASSTATITADAAAAGTGDALYSDPTGYYPKAITLWAGSSTIIKLGTDTGDGQISLSAKGGGNGGKGGAIVVSGQEVQLKTDNAVKVSALAGDSDGGAFLSWSYITNVATGLNGPVIDARGHGDGLGGKFQSYRASSIYFDPHKLIKVDGGDSIQTTDFNGSINLNNVTCQQWRTSYDWPLSYWNCTGNDPAASEDEVPASVASDLYSLYGLGSFESNDVLVSVFNNASEASYWFAESIPNVAGGITMEAGGEQKYLYLSVFRNGTNGGSGTVTYSGSQMEEVTAHEFGHAMDIIQKSGSVFQSHSTAYGNYVLRDLFDLDFVWDATLPTPDYISRDPCQATEFYDHTYSTEPPPFANVVNLHTSNSVCVSGALNSTDFPNTPYSNSELLNLLEGGFWSTNSASHWHEPYAHTFGHEVTGTQGARPMYDELLDQGYFQCINLQADALLAGNSSPSPTPNGWSGSCGTAPAGYTPF